MELSINDMVEDLQKTLPEEPKENDQNCVNLVFKFENNTYSRRFLKNDQIKVKLFFL